jgi:hypothetical protein
MILPYSYEELPRRSATRLTAARIARSAAPLERGAPSRASSTAASTVPCQVRKSLAETSRLRLQVGVDILGADVAPGAILAEDEKIVGAAATTAHRLDRCLDLRIADRLDTAAGRS